MSRLQDPMKTCWLVESQHLCVQNTPLVASYNSYSLMAAAAAAAHSSGQGLGSQPVGSLEALRATWHAPHLHGQGAWAPGSLGGQQGSFGGQSGQQQSPHSLHGQGLNGSLRQQGYLSSLQAVQEHNRYPFTFSGSLPRVISCPAQFALGPNIAGNAPQHCERSSFAVMPAVVTSGVESSHTALQGRVNRGFRQLLGLRPMLEMHHISSTRHEYKCIPL